MSTQRNLVGERFGRLTVVAYLGKSRWMCRCDCGRSSSPSTGELNRGGGKSAKSCGCISREKARSKKGEGWVGALAHRYRSSAKSRGLLFALSCDEVRSIVLRDCSYCGAPPAQSLSPATLARTPGWATARFNGIDRVDNDRGYTIDNVVTCCGTCNRAKHAMRLADFLAWARRLGARAAAGVI